MSIRVQTNLEALRAARQLSLHRADRDNVTQRLASGNRISRAADDAAGLSIANNLNVLSRSLDQATRNANDGISMIQVAEGALSHVGDILTRLRELGIQASSDTVGDDHRHMINREVQELRDEIERVAQTTEFDGRKLLSGNFSWPTLEVQVGIHEERSQNRIDINRTTISSSLASLGLTAINYSTKESAREYLGIIDEAISTVSRNRATMGAMINRFLAAAGASQLYSEGTKGARSRIQDTDYAYETAQLTRNNIIAEAGTSILAQANQQPGLAMKLLG